MIPVYHVYCLAAIKIHLLQHLQDLDAIYTFLLCCDPYDVTVTASPSCCGKIGGKKDIYRYIREFIFDIKQHFPSTRFSVRSKQHLRGQITTLLRLMMDVDQRCLKEMLQSEHWPVLHAKYNKMMPTCLFHDESTKELLRELII
jgi:hypothetical protein